MKRLFAILAVLLLCPAAPVWAADGSTEQYVVRLDVLQTTDDTAHAASEHLASGFVGQALQSGHARLVQSVQVVAVPRADFALLVGHKNPIVYMDPRARQFQIQFVDVGVKLLGKCTQAADGTLEVESNSELSALESVAAPGGPNVTVYPQTEVLQAHADISHVRLGESVLLAQADSRDIRQLLGLVPGAKAEPGNHLMLILTVSQCAAPAAAAVATDRPAEVEVRLLRVSGAAAPWNVVRVVDAAEVEHAIHAGALQVLDGSSGSGSLEKEVSVLSGRKVPIAYADPQTGGYQVQYVDSGLKMSVSSTAMVGGRVRLATRVERQTLEERASGLPNQDGVRVNTVTLLGPGQVAIVGAVHGGIDVQYLKRAYPTLTDNDTVLIAVGLRQH